MMSAMDRETIREAFDAHKRMVGEFERAGTNAVVVAAEAITRALRSAKRKVKKGNSVIGPGSPSPGVIDRLGFQYH